MHSEPKIQQISMGGKVYLDRDSLLAFLEKRAKLTLEKLRCHGTPLADTEYLRGQSVEQETLKREIQPPQISE